jgi:hypothetical protein
MEKRGVAHLVLIVVLVVVAAVLVVSLTGNIIYSEDVKACTDSDVTEKHPDGINFDQGGDTRLGKSRYRDHCSSGKLVEYYCSNGQVEEIEVDCETSCHPGFGRCR